jgi:hypothetical protein
VVDPAGCTVRRGLALGIGLALMMAVLSVPSVASAIPPANDNFADAEAITGFPAVVPVRNGDATKEPGEPNHAGALGGHSVWWTWTAPASVAVQVYGCAGSGSSVVAVYTGDNVDSLTAVTGTYQPGGSRCQLSFRATAGQVYRIAFDDISCCGFELVLRAPPPNDNFADAGLIADFPAAVRGTGTYASREPREPKHAGYAWNSVWWTWGAPSSGPTLVTTCRSETDAALAVYTGNSVDHLTELVSDYGGAEGCAGSMVAFYAIAGRVYRIAVAGSGGRISLNVKPATVREDFTGGSARAVLQGGNASGTILDVARGGRTRQTRRNKVLGINGRISPPVLPGTPGRRDICPDYHYHGRLLGRRDPHPDGCGWGSVRRYGHMRWFDRQRAAAATDRRLALRARSFDYAFRKLREGRRHLEAVVNWMIGYGDDSFEDVEPAVWSLEEAEALFRRAHRGETRADRRRLMRRARSWIRDSLDTYE